MESERKASYSTDFCKNEIICCVIIDKSKNALLLVNLAHDVSGEAFWFPYTRILQAETTNEAANRLLTNLKFFDQTPKILNVVRIYSTHLLPVSKEQSARVNYLLCESHEEFNLEEHKDFRWMNSVKMRHALKRHQMMGLEPIQILKRIEENKLSNLDLNFFFYEPRMNYIDSSNQMTPVENLITSAKFTRKLQEQLFALFFSHTYPSEYMSFAKFKILFEKIFKMSDIEVTLTKMKSYFFSFDLQQRQMLTYSDILQGELNFNTVRNRAIDLL